MSKIHPSDCICAACTKLKQAIAKPRPITAIHPQDQICIRPSPEIKQFSIAHLRSGGPALTVLSIIYESKAERMPERQVKVAHFDNQGVLHKDFLPFASLVICAEGLP